MRWCTNSAYFLWRISNLIFNFLTQMPSRSSTWSGDTPWSKFYSRPKTNKKGELQCVFSHCTFIHKWSKVEMLSINPWQLLLLIKYTFIQHKAFLLTCIWYWYILAEYTQTSATLKLFFFRWFGGDGLSGKDHRSALLPSNGYCWYCYARWPEK